MFKKMLGFMVLAFFVLSGVGIITSAQAETYDNFRVTFNCNRVVSVSVSTDMASGALYEPRINFGLVNTLTQVIASTCVFVHNTSDASSASIQNYSMYIATRTGTYTLNTTFDGGEDSYAVAAVFKPAYPVAGSFNDEDVLRYGSANIITWNASVLNPNSGTPYTGTPADDANVGAHAKGDFPARLYLSLMPPTAVSATDTQTLGVTIIAQ